MSNIDDMPLFKIHTARKTIETDEWVLYNACKRSGVIESNGRYLNVKSIEVLQTNDTYKTEYPD